MKTAQELVEIGVFGVIEQGELSVKEDIDGRHCLYRYQKEDGTCLKCVVGHMIPDEVCPKDIDVIESGKSSAVDDVLQSFEFLEEHIIPSDMDYDTGVMFLAKLQVAHDSSLHIFDRTKHTKGFGKTCIDLGKEYGLDTSKIEQYLYEIYGE